MEFMFSKLPKARMCLDLAHARQLDTTLTLLSDLLSRFVGRIAEIHISELDSRCQHVPMSWSAVEDYQRLPWGGDACIPVIIESMLEDESTRLRKDEVLLARKAFERSLEGVVHTSR
jgi:hypothetical protein